MAMRASDRRLLGDRQGRRTMVWIMAIMIFLTVLAAAMGLSVAGAGSALDQQLAGRLTVQVVEADAAKRDAAVARLLAGLRKAPMVTRAVEVDRAELAELMRPWLGEAGLDADLPIPAMVDVDLRQSDDTAVAAVTRIAHAATSAARVDWHASWLAPVRGFLRTLGWVAFGLVAVMASATAAVVLLSARAGLDTHRGTIDILHMLGATDVQIARLFQQRIAVDTLTGGLIGTVAGLAVVVVVGLQIGGLESQVLAGLALSTVDWLLIVATPIAFMLLAMVAARIAVLRALGQVL
ncbi:cell division protein FtsX [Sphingomonas sp. ACRSK]|uniref:cell division protein FtsX n=1 Tax=Sphingomonas sp. ACRSK TaxID=2918213 RepID=UPI001EF6193C|nr:FtsX-like permease family protein [Sphingomonas sp. ACRSK]MCG7346660.1 permease [Sphingomonas sp. ACRSK]